METIPGVEVRSTNRVLVTWTGGQSFTAGRADGPVQVIDGDAVTGPSPVDTLLNALAACTAIDVVEILAKRRTPVATLSVSVEGARAQATPSRLIGIVLHYTISGAGIERTHAERAVDLSVNKYCSVRDSLDPNLPVRWTLALDEG